MTFRQLPGWARKPKHKQEVVASDRGWVVKETGELLKTVKNLSSRLKQLRDEAQKVADVISEPVVEAKTAVEEVVSEELATESEVEVQEVVEEVVESPKRRGRPPKNKNATN